MKKLILVGSGGCMRELLWQIKEFNDKVEEEEQYNVLGYIDVAEDLSMLLNSGLDYLGDDDYLLNLKEDVDVVICIGSPSKRRELRERYRKNEKLHFPSIVLATEGISDSCRIGEGSVVSTKAVISANVTIGDFVFVNIGACICHDSDVQDYATLAPMSLLCGNVSVGEGSYIGAHATVIQGLTVGKDVMIGAGATVVCDIDDDITAVGVPAKVKR